MNILLRGAREHNLKNIDLDIPREKIVVFTGVSGSGKSSLVFDTLCAEAQRQLIETFSSFARRRLPKISKPDVDVIENLSTAVIIDQKRLGTTMRSTVGTATEIYTYLRLMFSRIGEPFIGFSDSYSFNNPKGMCPACQGLGKEMVIDLNQILDWDKSVHDGAITYPGFRRGGYFWRIMTRCGFFDPFKPIRDFSERELHNLLYMEATEFLGEHNGAEYKTSHEGVVTKLKKTFADHDENENAYTRFFSYSTCKVCEGARINEKGRSVKINEKTIPDLVFLELPDLLAYLSTINNPVAAPIIRKMKASLENLISIGLGYLSLHRPVATLSGGESQRLKMANQLDINLVGLMYILDEPTIGLHPADVGNLLGIIKNLRDRGNSVLVVEHDPMVMEIADHVIEIGPEAGSGGGHILYTGDFNGLCDSDTPTGRHLDQRRKARGGREQKEEREKIKEKRVIKDWFRVEGATANNLKNISVSIPKGVLTCITGVAGSGKSSLIHQEFLHRYPDSIVVDQSGVGRSSRSNPLTYVGIFDPLRKAFSAATGHPASLFSFNSDGACPKCNGLGILKLEMSFLDDVTMVCDECNGKRYKQEVLNLHLRGNNIFEILRMTVNEAVTFFTEHEINRKLLILQEVGLGYLELGQPLSTLSGGEAQRIKLANELHKKGNIYIMDEPTTGLHMSDIENLLKIIDRLVNRGNSVIIIEHNLDIIRHADWIIDLGPSGGSRGGYVLAAGTPEQLASDPKSMTGIFLRDATGPDDNL
ncbi:MAG TPA: daunorubicin resistance protein DrrC [Bacteroidales bacterium]|nr:daunorubicin resistance protein DrrC [Bacteroidales bacterium]